MSIFDDIRDRMKSDNPTYHQQHQSLARRLITRALFDRRVVLTYSPVQGSLLKIVVDRFHTVADAQAGIVIDLKKHPDRSPNYYTIFD